MIERLLIGLMLVVGVGLLLLGKGTAGIILLVLGLILGVVFYRMENKKYSVTGYYGNDERYYVIKDAKLTDDRE